MSDLVRALPPALPAWSEHPRLGVSPSYVAIGARVRLHAVPNDDIPEGALGTVVDIYPGDDDVIVVVADLRPACRLLYPWPEFVMEAVVLSEVTR